MSSTLPIKPADLPKRLALTGIRLYQLTLSPYLGRQCRFYPSCSHYAMEAIERHGAVHGGGRAPAVALSAVSSRRRRPGS